MASRELPWALSRLTARCPRRVANTTALSGRRFASSEASNAPYVVTDLEELEPQSSFAATNYSTQKIEAFDPAKRAKGRKRELPPSRYQFRSPRFYRGPLHPHQPPPASDPSSRVFVPGPFSRTRLEQTYQSTIAPDLMTLVYVHKPPGTVQEQKADRLRTWDDSSPYHKGRPKRGPRGPGDRLRVIEKDFNWRDIPEIKEVTVHSMVKRAAEDSAYLHVAGMMLQAITGVRPQVHKVKHSLSEFGIRKAQAISLTCTMRGDQAYDFVDRCINLVFPKMKDWSGIQGSTGDSSGNLSFGFDKEAAILFPEVEVNYDMYPPHMITGFHVTVKTSATSDRHARLLLGALGMPFTGKLVD